MLDIHTAFGQPKIGFVDSPRIRWKRALIDGLILELYPLTIEPVCDLQLFEALDAIPAQGAEFMGFYPLIILVLTFKIPLAFVGPIEFRKPFQK